MSKFLLGARLACAGLTLVLSTSSLIAAQTSVDHMVIFGDSLSDTGNLYSLIHYPYPPAYVLGRATDGPTTYPASAIDGMWDEQLAPSLGVGAPQPDLVSSANLNFSFIGAETGAIANSATGAYGMAAQVERYLDEKPANIATAIHFFWGGTNDVFDYSDASGAEKTAIANISGQIASIAGAGGKYFVWFNLFPLERTPRGAGSAALKAACADFATDMPQAIASLRAQYPGITIIPVDVYSLFNQIVQAPAQFGLTNVTTPAQSSAVNPDQYLFWDALHPTTKMHQIVAGLALSDINRVLVDSSAQVKAPVSEDFNASSLNTSLWTVEAPPDATVSVTNGHASLALPAGANHDPFVGGDHAARILQPISNTDFDVAAKFDSTPALAYQGQGIMVQQEDGTFLRFEVDSDGSQLSLFGASVRGGAETNYFSTPFAGGVSVWLEVKRSGDTWTLNSSVDGVNYTQAGTFNQAITVSAIGPYAWNYDTPAAASPATLSLVDYFYNMAQ
jgi:thermolabile hemolysin